MLCSVRGLFVVLATFHGTVVAKHVFVAPNGFIKEDSYAESVRRVLSDGGGGLAKETAAESAVRRVANGNNGLGQRKMIGEMIETTGHLDHDVHLLELVTSQATPRHSAADEKLERAEEGEAEEHVDAVEAKSANARGQTLKRMQYWASVADASMLPPTDRYLIFHSGNQGMNDIRRGFETVAAFAQLTNRTLVLPPAIPFQHLDFGSPHGSVSGRSGQTFPDYGHSVTKLDDVINLAQLTCHLPTLTWNEFAKRTGLTYEQAEAKAGKVYSQEDKLGCGCAFDPCPCSCPSLEKLRAATDDILSLCNYGADVLESCADFRGTLNDKHAMFTKENWKLLTHGCVWHPDAFSIASKVVNRFGIFKYNALHGRMAYYHINCTSGGECAPEGVLPRKIFQNWPQLLQDVDTLYIASDMPEKFDELNFGNVTMIRWTDLSTEKTNFLLKDEQAKYTPERWFKLIGLVEELICTYSKLFVGTGYSGFTKHIHRMRIHAQAPFSEEYQMAHRDWTSYFPRTDHDNQEYFGARQQEFARWKDRERGRTLSGYHGHDPSFGDILPYGMA